jgi:hypothetical protein
MFFSNVCSKAVQTSCFSCRHPIYRRLATCHVAMPPARAKSVVSGPPKRRGSGASTATSAVCSSITKGCASVVAKAKRAAATAGSKALAKALSMRNVDGAEVGPVAGICRDESGAIICRRCKVKGSDPDTWAKFVYATEEGVTVKRLDESIDACKKCHRVYEMAFSAGGTWEEVTMETNCNVQANSEFEGACKVFDGFEKRFKEEEVQERRACGARALVLQRGLRPAEFFLRFQRSHEDLGLPLQNLFHPDRSYFQGVLVKDDGKFGDLGVIYEYWSEFGADFTTKHMTATLQLHPMQGKAVFDHLVSPSGGENDNMKRLRNANVKNLNVESIHEAIRTLEAQQLVADELKLAEPCALLCAAVANDLGASPRGVATLGVETPQASGHKRKASSLDGDMETPRSEKGDQDVDMESISGLLDSDPVEQRIRECSLSVILGGKRLGHKRRRMKEIMDDLYSDASEVTRAESHAIANRLSARLKSANYADKVADEIWVLSSKNEDVFEAVDNLLENGASFTSTNMESFLKRRLQGFGLEIFSSDVHLEGFLLVASAWSTPTVGLPELKGIGKGFMALDLELHFVTATELTEFVPLRATMAKIDGSVLDKAVTMTKFVFAFFFTPLMANYEKIGRAAALNALLLLDKGLAKAPAEMASEWADTAYAMMVAARFLVHLLNPLDTSYVTEFEDVLERFALGYACSMALQYENGFPFQ